MPEIRYYTCTQEREVKVTASSPAEAAHLASAAFWGTISDEDISKVNILSPVRERDLVIREDY